MKIRSHLALIVTATLLPVVIFSAVALEMMLESERKAALKGLQEVARSTALIVDRDLGSAAAELRVLAGSQRLARSDWPAFYEQAKALSSTAASWTYLVDADGTQLINTGVAYGAALPQLPHFAAPASLPALQSGRPMVSDLLNLPLSPNHITTVSVPVDINGVRRYALARAFTSDYFSDVFRQPGISPAWTVAIFDRHGSFVARTHAGESMIGHPARPELVAAAAAAAQGTLRHKTWEGTDSFDVFTHSDLSGWTVAVAVPADMVESAARQAVMVAALGLLAALIMAAGTAALVSRRLVASISDVDNAAKVLASGQTPAPVHTGVAEMDALADVLANAGTILQGEKSSRLEAESQRARLMENERIARQQAERQNHAKDQFLAMLGHELRNPLSAISGAIAVMKARDASAALNTRAHGIIERQSNHLSHIVDDLLDLSRMSMGKITLHRQPVELAAMVHAAVDTLYAAGRVGQCDIGIESEPAWIDADRTRLDQIIGNVIGNALKFSSLRGRIDISVACEGGEAIWTVRDFGIGISAELMPNIFDAFVQGAAQADHALGGLGIGLNLVHQLVALHGGTIDVRSAGTGTGTTVEVRLPLRNGSGAAPSALEHVGAGPGGVTRVPQQSSAPLKTRSVPVRTPAAAKSTVLLIEDNADSREMMSMLLGMLGYQVLEAANGIDGLGLAQSERPAIAVIDIGLPDIDGYAVARQLRATTGLHNMTLIALTGYGQDADRKRALAAGFDSHLVKPLDMDVLVNTIISHQAKQNAHSQGAGSDV